MPNPNCQTCKGLGGYPRCPECLNATPKTSPPPDYEGAVKVLECVASDYEYRAKIYGKHPGAECGNLAGHEKSKAEACRAAIRAMTPYLPKHGEMLKRLDAAIYFRLTANLPNA